MSAPCSSGIARRLQIRVFRFFTIFEVKRLWVACDRVLGTDSKIEKKIEMTSFRGAGRTLSFFSGGFP